MRYFYKNYRKESKNSISNISILNTCIWILFLFNSILSSFAFLKLNCIFIFVNQIKITLRNGIITICDVIKSAL